MPYMLIIGEKEVENNTISARSRDTDETASYTLEEFITKILKDIADRA